ncbi:MAG: AMP-binding protein, partial [Micrococcales bacterium]
MSNNTNIEVLLTENRHFPPSEAFKKQAIAGEELYAEAKADRDEFWKKQARHLHWHKPFTQGLDWSDAPFAKWFADGELNVAYNCLDRHVAEGRGDRVAIHFEGEPGDQRSYTYAELTTEVKKAANLLSSLGVVAGDRVAIYLPMIPEAAIAMLAVARLGAIHSVIFGGFSAEALHTRIDDGRAKLVITADGGYRKGKPFALKPAVDEAVAHGKSPSVKHVLVVKRTGQEVAWNDELDIWWQDALDKQSAEHEAQAFPAENPLFILYTSGTTGKPKGILHTSGGYLTQASYTHRNVFDLHPENDVDWCTADVGWITGHSYVVYGPL